MDLSTFSQDNYDLKEAINEIFRSSEAKSSKDVKQFASSMVMRLQLAIQEVNNGIEETSSQVVMSLPRVLRDIEALSHEAEILKNQMVNVKEDIETVEKSTAASMQTLVQLDMVKGRFSASSQALKEADNWTTLSSDIEEVMDLGDLDAISKKLIALQNCLTIITHVPDYEDRVAHLEGLKVRLEALLSPHLVAAFTQHNLEDSTKYSKMLRALGRSKNLESYYHKCEQQQLQTAWRVSVEGNIMSGPPNWLPSFLNTLSSLITKQAKWCEHVFQDSNPHALLASLTRSVLSELDPSLSNVVSVSIKQQEDPLVFLTTIKSYLDSFIQDYRSVIKSSDGSLFEVNREVFGLIYSPLKNQLKDYKDLEESVLLSHLVTSDIVKDDLAESLQALRDYCSNMIVQIEISSDRCLQLSGGICFPALICAVATYVENFNDRLAQVARHVEQQTTSIEDDWTVFNTCLSLIQAAGELLIVVDTMEHSLATILAKAASKFQWETTSDPYTPTPDVLLSPKDKLALEKLIKAVVENDERLLGSCLTLAQDQCGKSVDVALNTIMSPVSSQLSLVPSLTSWNPAHVQSSILSVGFSPQEYVTQIGQYLMTLPQHLEPLLVSHTPALNRALHETSLRSSSDCRIVSESEISAADFLIESVSQSTCRLYTDVILKIPEIVPHMITQLTTDIDYICNIFEDLGVTSCDPLDKLNSLLKVPSDQYWNVAPGNPPRIVAAVRQIRDIPAKS